MHQAMEDTSRGKHSSPAQVDDPLHIGGGPMTRAKARRMKEALSGLIKDVRAKQEAIGADLDVGHPTKLLCMLTVWIDRKDAQFQMS